MARDNSSRRHRTLERLWMDQAKELVYHPEGPGEAWGVVLGSGSRVSCEKTLELRLGLKSD